MARWLDKMYASYRGKRVLPDWLPEEEITEKMRVQVAWHQLKKWYRAGDILFSHKKEIEKKSTLRCVIFYEFKRDGDMLVPCEKEIAVVKLIYGLREKGESYQEIVNYLEARGIPTKNKRCWSKSTIYRILKNPIYKNFS